MPVVAGAPAGAAAAPGSQAFSCCWRRVRARPRAAGVLDLTLLFL